MKTLLVISDTHSNSITGLSKPIIELDDGSSVSAGTVRRWIFHNFEDVLEQADKKRNGDLYGLLNGDIVEMDAKDRHRTELITQNKEEARQAAIDVLEPFFGICKGVWVNRGTPAHTGEQAQWEESIAANFNNTIQNPETGNFSQWHLALELDGVPIDACHHPRGGGSGRPMNSQSGVDRIASDTLFWYANNRPHLHAYRDSGDAFATRAIITPPMCLLTEYTYRLGINFAEDIGAILIYCDNGEYFVEPLRYPVRKPQWQVI